MKKILYCLILVFSLLFININSNIKASNLNNNSSISNLINEYYNNGVYVKETTIYLNENGVADLAEYFHVETYLKRTTYYLVDSLWMSQKDLSMYSYYGTSYNNNIPNGITYGETSNVLTPPSSVKLALSGVGKNSMEEYYTTLKDILEYDDSIWSYDNGVYTTQDPVMLKYFLDFTAPCLYESIMDSHIFSYEKATIKEVDNNLELLLWIHSTNYGYIEGGVDSVVDNSVVLSKAVIKKHEIKGSLVDTYPSLSNADVAYFNGSIYTYGGYDGKRRTNSIYCYNIASNSLYELDVKLQDVSTSHRVYLYGGKVYIFGGTTGSVKLSTIQVHDLVNQTIETLDTKLLFGIHCQQMGYYKNKVYFAGAQTTSGSTKDIYELDLDTLEMTKLNISLPTVAFKGGWCTVGKYLYVIGGTMGPRLDTIYRFDMENYNVDTLNAHLPVTLSQSRAVYDGIDNIYIYGGTIEGNSLVNTIYRYNIYSDTIVELDEKLPINIANTCVVYVNGATYILGGDNNTINLILKHEDNKITNIFNSVQ